MRKLKLALALLFVAGLVHAETAPDARKWLDKIAALGDAGPYFCTISADIAGMPGAPPGAKVAIQGKMTQSSRRQSRMEMTLTFATPPAAKTPSPGGAPPPAMPPIKVLVVNDGKDLWTQTEMMGGMQVMKASLELSEKLGKQGGGAGLGTSMDPMSQVTAMTETMDFKVLSQEGDVVRLQGQLKDTAAARMPGMDSMVMTLDAKTGFFRQIAIGANMIVIDFKDFQRLRSVDPATFTYTPPSGVAVQDLGPMLEARLKALSEKPATPGN